MATYIGQKLVADSFISSSLAEQLASGANKGDACYRSDLNALYIHNGGVAGTIADWTLETAAALNLSGLKTRWATMEVPTLTTGTSTTPSATTVYIAQVVVAAACTLTGFQVSNGATVGTNKYVVALFDSAGAVLKNSALAGALSSGADAYQAVAFTATIAVSPGVYWVGLYVDGTTDRFRTIPAAGAYTIAGSATGQTFGTVAAITPPTTFTADKGPVGFLY